MVGNIKYPSNIHYFIVYPQDYFAHVVWTCLKLVFLLIPLLCLSCSFFSLIDNWLWIFMLTITATQNLCMPHSYIHRTTLMYVILKFVVHALTLNIACVCSLNKRQTLSSLTAVHCILYIFLQMFWCHWLQYILLLYILPF